MKKALNVIKNVLVWLIIISAVSFMLFTLFSVLVFDKENISIFGYKFFIVQSDSMSATDFRTGDLIISKNVDPEQLSAGDIITFISENPSSRGETVTHKIRDKGVNDEGKPGFITYGTTTDSNDEALVTYDHIIGRYTGKLSGAGAFFAYLKTTPGYITCVVVPFTVLILYYGIKVVILFRRYKKEQTAEIEAERQKLDMERKESEKRLKELKELEEKLKREQEHNADNE